MAQRHLDGMERNENVTIILSPTVVVTMYMTLIGVHEMHGQVHPNYM